MFRHTRECTAARTNVVKQLRRDTFSKPYILNTVVFADAAERVEHRAERREERQHEKAARDMARVSA